MPPRRREEGERFPGEVAACDDEEASAETLAAAATGTALGVEGAAAGERPPCPPAATAATPPLKGEPKAAPAPAAATAAAPGADPAACEPKSDGESGTGTGAEEEAASGEEGEGDENAFWRLEEDAWRRASSIVAGIGIAGVRVGPKDAVAFGFRVFLVLGGGVGVEMRKRKIRKRFSLSRSPRPATRPRSLLFFLPSSPFLSLPFRKRRNFDPLFLFSLRGQRHWRCFWRKRQRVSEEWARAKS